MNSRSLSYSICVCVCLLLMLCVCLSVDPEQERKRERERERETKQRMGWLLTTICRMSTYLRLSCDRESMESVDPASNYLYERDDSLSLSSIRIHIRIRLFIHHRVPSFYFLWWLFLTELPTPFFVPC